MHGGRSSGCSGCSGSGGGGGGSVSMNYAYLQACRANWSVYKLAGLPARGLVLWVDRTSRQIEKKRSDCPENQIGFPGRHLLPPLYNRCSGRVL